MCVRVCVKVWCEVHVSPAQANIFVLWSMAGIQVIMLVSECECECGCECGCVDVSAFVRLRGGQVPSAEGVCGCVCVDAHVCV